MAGYGVVWIVAAIEPHDRFDWLLENLLVFAWVAILVFSYRRFQLSNLSYLLIAVFLSLHTVGSHYTYSLTPLGFWIQTAFELERNHYDRIVHFLFGLLLVYPMREVILRRVQARGRWSYFLPLCVILAFSEFYEILEWATAEVVSPEAALAFLGTQGDVFDAQKDSALAGIGALLGLAATALARAGSKGRT